MYFNSWLRFKKLLGDYNAELLNEEIYVTVITSFQCARSDT